jgi:hypothetical protein
MKWVDRKDRHSLVPRQFDQQSPKVIASGGVNAGGRFVEDQHFGAVQHGHGQGQALTQAQG